MTTSSARLATATEVADARPARWRLQLLGRFQLSDGQRVHTRLATRAMVALLARLALWPQRDHAREELAELLWPGVEASAGRRRLRQALSMLKDVLEPPEHGFAPVLQADRLSLRLVAGALHCDVHDFERHRRAGDAAAAASTYQGDLLPGLYDEWIVDERTRLTSLHDDLLLRAPPPLPRQDVAPPPALAARPAGAAQRTDRSTLPVFLTRYLDNGDQLQRLADQVRRHRWVTLLGPGGGGKTRLAVELGHRMHAPEAAAADTADALADSFDRVVFVPLVGALQPPEALALIARALRIESSNPEIDTLVARIAGWRTLLILDNVEQLIGAIEPLLVQLMTSLPSLHLLVTSRRSLGLDGERQFHIAPLALPTPDASVQAVACSAAVALFVDRAMAVRADFHVSPRNHAVLAALVASLDGMPLAIELAASRLRSISPAEMLQRLQRGAVTPGETPQLDLLARPSEGGAADPRHASMLRTIEWSWRQLDDAQRQLAGAMTVFGGGCSLRMLQHVSGGGAEVALVLDSLQSHSLVHARTDCPAVEAGADPDDDARRFQLYEPIREYASARFDSAQAAHWRSRHRAWAIAWAKALPVTPSLAEVRAQLPNIAAALHSAATDDAGHDAVALLLALHHTLEDVELPHAALAHASAAVDACRDDAMRSRGHTAIGPMLYAAGQKEASLRHVEAALAGVPGDSAARARALYAIARLRWRSDLQHPERVLPMVAEAYALAEAADDAYLMAGLLSLQAFATHVQDGTPDAALALHRRALQQWERFGNRHAANNGRYNVAVFEFHSGRATLALSQMETLAAEATVLQDWRRVAIVSDARGTILAGLRRWAEALLAHRDSLALGWQSMSIYNLAYGFWNLPRTLAHLRQPALALSLAAFAEVFWTERVGSLSASDVRELLKIRRLAARQLDARACAQAWARGRLLSLPEAMALALER